MKKETSHPLRRARCQHNLTIGKLAEEAKVGASTIWRAEHDYPISAESRRRLCSYFGMTSQELGLLDGEKKDVASAQTIIEDRRQPATSDRDAQIAHEQPDSLSRLAEMAPPWSFGIHDQPGVWLVREASRLSSLLDTRWTLDSMFDALRVVFVGVQGLPVALRNEILRAESYTLVNTLAPRGEKYLSEEARLQITNALNQSIEQGWLYFHTLGPMQVLVIGQALLYLMQQTQSFLEPSACYGFYAAIYNLVGSALYFQGQYEAAQQVHEKGYRAALEGADLWSQTQSLNWRAIIACARGRHNEAIQFIETALRLLKNMEGANYQRLRAHLLANLAYNASHIDEWEIAQDKLTASAKFLENLEQNEEFDQARWHQMAGDCLLLRRKYTAATHHLEQSLVMQPEQWINRRVLTMLPLAKAYAYKHDREASIAVARQAAEGIQTTASTMLEQRFVEYLHILTNAFPRDKTVREFITGTQQQLLVQH